MIVKLLEDILQGSFLKYREVEMRPMRGVYMGIEWKPLTLESKNYDDEVIVNFRKNPYANFAVTYYDCIQNSSVFADIPDNIDNGYFLESNENIDYSKR